MSQRKIFECAVQKGLNLISITDHNHYENNKYVGPLVDKYGINFLYGIEVQSAEEVHLLALFDSYEQLESFGKLIYEFLPDVPNNPDYFGDQVVVNEKEEIVRFENRLLINSVGLSLDETISLVKDNGGIVIPSHVNANHFSIVSQLGFIPVALNVEALEVLYSTDKADLGNNSIPGIEGYPIVTFSDSHYPHEIGRGYVVFWLEKPSVEEIKKALMGLDGRKYEVYTEKGRIL